MDKSFWGDQSGLGMPSQRRSEQGTREHKFLHNDRDERDNNYNSVAARHNKYCRIFLLPFDLCYKSDNTALQYFCELKQS